MDNVGRPLPEVYIKLDNINEHGEGEVCMGGRHVFMGYLKELEKTAEAKDKNGWLHSGDLGKFDSNGFLSITGKHFKLINIRNTCEEQSHTCVCDYVSEYDIYIFFSHSQVE